MLQDSSGGVFIHCNLGSLVSSPHVGERWKVQGSTEAGGFSPVLFTNEMKFIGIVSMPDPIYPTWDQLMNGSLDTEYVEVRGVVTSAAQTEMNLLTPDGEVIIEGDSERPLPHLASSASA